ncbi:hypothetical protein ACFQU7_03590 [Pseudoroseomonas wenyumeiae]
MRHQLAAQGPSIDGQDERHHRPRMSEGQRAYEAKRAAKAGKTLEQWLKLKAQEREALLAAAAKAAPRPSRRSRASLPA